MRALRAANDKERSCRRGLHRLPIGECTSCTLRHYPHHYHSLLPHIRLSLSRNWNECNNQLVPLPSSSLLCKGIISINQEKNQRRWQVKQAKHCSFSIHWHHIFLHRQNCRRCMMTYLHWSESSLLKDVLTWWKADQTIVHHNKTGHSNCFILHFHILVNSIKAIHQIDICLEILTDWKWSEK